MVFGASNGINVTSYVYDAQGQLVRENNQGEGKTWTYTYDAGGNITQKAEYAYATGTLTTPIDTIDYGYADSNWPDLLTAYDGRLITSDAIGNMTSDGTWVYTWQHGRQLSRMWNQDTQLEFEYNADGLRIHKTLSNGTYTDMTTVFGYNGTQLTNMEWVLPGAQWNNIHFTYDANGQRVSMNWNGDAYLYVYNAQGDVVALIDTSNGEVAVAYTYDAWGKVLSVTGTLAGTLRHTNPFLYRGYFYDWETGLYCLQSRYYNPIMGRFINADSSIAGVSKCLSGFNLFVYCFNNPSNLDDPSGHWPKWATKMAVAVAVVAVVVIVAAVIVATAGAGTAIAAIAVGAAKGAMVGFAVGAAVGAAAGAVNHRISTGSWNGAGQAALNGMANGALIGAISGAITGGITGGLNYSSNATTSTGKGFDSFSQLKSEIGSPGPGNEWHHIVEQNQITKSGFDTQMVQNTNNIISISREAHRAISGYYSSIQPFSGGQIVRNWLAGQSFEAQYQFGINVIELFS